MPNPRVNVAPHAVYAIANSISPNEVLSWLRAQGSGQAGQSGQEVPATISPHEFVLNQGAVLNLGLDRLGHENARGLATLNQRAAGVQRFGLGGVALEPIEFPAANMGPQFTSAPSTESGGAINPGYPTPSGGYQTPLIPASLPTPIAPAVAQAQTAPVFVQGYIPPKVTRRDLAMNWGGAGFNAPSGGTLGAGGLAAFGPDSVFGASFGPGILGELGLGGGGGAFGGMGSKPLIL